MSCLILKNQKINNNIILNCTTNQFFYINFCFFQSIFNPNTNGGCFFLSLTGIQTFILNNKFLNCSSNFNGGSFFIEFLNYSEINKNCFYNCQSKLGGQSFNIKCIINKSQIINYNTFFECSKLNFGNIAVIHIDGGIQNVNYNNITYSWIKDWTILYNRDSSNIFSNFNNLINNIATIILEQNGISGNFSNFNLINNTEPIYKYGLIHCSGNNFYNNFIILLNKFIILQSSTGTAIFINCIFYNNLFITSQILNYPSTIEIKQINCYFLYTINKKNNYFKFILILNFFY